ncbi:RNA-binding domain-containing protein [Artomyces pyxidatus]|uniref:RNA-binding domain-containing protein n=1 Tax=Artomyces pyxidatus TaxID=48021 RepID=A0ACB8TEQ5_9AGAM|nr:RNA-binding domain-containing protein [Artomyces pyxidatus]
MSNPDNSLFRFAREASAVRVGNVPPGVSGREVVELFRTLVGPIRNVEITANGSAIELTFATPDAASKSLCMSGYNISGSPLTVTAVNSARLPNRPSSHARSTDTRRNLYVLGLPFDLTKSELISIFTRCGTVSHCVILATVDNASRRRGFVVMSTHEEAKAAMESLSRTDIRGSIVDVSWAVVQRSQGFLDGGDPVAPTNGRSLVDVSNGRPSDVLNGDSSGSSLVVSNLPTLLFSQPSDLEPLFFPFGDIKRLERLPASPADLYSGAFSVVVTYSSAASAQEAKDSLQGQNYANQSLVVEFLSPFNNAFYSAPAALGTNHSNSSSSSLNPRASPFVFGYSSPSSAPPTCAISEPAFDYFSIQKPIASGLASPVDFGPGANLVPYQYRSLPGSSVPSRSSSAASWLAQYALSTLLRN